MNTINPVASFRRRSVLLGAGSLLASAASIRGARAQAPKDLAALIDAAKAEGEVMFYSAATVNVAQRIAAAFTAKYGIKANFLRLDSTVLLQRFSTEAEAGNFIADLIFVAGRVHEFSTDGVKKGWIRPVQGLPAQVSGEFAAKYTREASALIQIAPWGMAVNTDRVKTDLPTTWKDLLAPRYKGQLLISDVTQSDALLDFWGLLLDTYGEVFFKSFLAQSPRLYPGVVPATQAIGAGEGMVQLPNVAASVTAVTSKGAPVQFIIPDLATGVEMQLVLTQKSKHPNAANLLAHYVMSLEGNKVFNDDPGSLSVYDTSKLPKQYTSPKPGVYTRLGEIKRVLNQS